MKLTITAVDEPSAPIGAHPGACAVRGEGGAGPVLEGGDLRHTVVTLGAGATLEWPEAHGEEALYVLDGAVAADGRVLPVGAVVLLHAGGRYRLDAPQGARLAHFWGEPAPAGVPIPPRPGPAEAHVLGPEGWARSGRAGASMATWYADSTCAGCDLTFMKVERDTPGNRGRAHTHSADEIISVIEGSISFGAHQLPQGTAAHVPADTRYAVTCGPSRHAFLNFRAGPSTQHYEGDPEPVPETALGRGGHLVS